MPPPAKAKDTSHKVKKKNTQELMKEVFKETEKRRLSAADKDLPSSDSERENPQPQNLNPKRFRNDMQSEQHVRPRQIGVYLEALNKTRLLDSTVGKKLHDNKLKFNHVYSKGYSQALVLFSNTTEANLLINHSTILNQLKCTATLSTPKPPTRGVIRGVDVNITENELLVELNSHPDIVVKKVSRIMQFDKEKGDGSKRPTPVVMLDFSSPSLPSRVFFYSIVRRVEVSISKPRICYKCQNFGHMAKQCKSRLTVCGHCAQGHDTRECPRENAQPVCVNCDGAHSPSSIECPVMRQKYSARLENTLKETQFQQMPNLNSQFDFPDTFGEAQSHAAEQEPAVRESKTLPRAAQKKRVKIFSEVLAAKTRTKEQALEHRRNQYKPLLTETPLPREARQRNNPKQKQTNPTPSHTTRNIQDQSPIPSSQPPKVDLTNMSASQVNSLIRQMLTNKQALTLLITILSVIINVSVTNQDTNYDAESILHVQQEILRVLDTQQVQKQYEINVEDEEERNDDESTHLPSNMEHLPSNMELEYAL